MSPCSKLTNRKRRLLFGKRSIPWLQYCLRNSLLRPRIIRIEYGHDELSARIHRTLDNWSTFSNFSFGSRICFTNTASSTYRNSLTHSHDWHLCRTPTTKRRLLPSTWSRRYSSGKNGVLRKCRLKSRPKSKIHRRV